MVKDHLVAQAFLELAEELCCESGLLMKLVDVLLPLLVEKCVSVLYQR